MKTKLFSSLFLGLLCAAALSAPAQTVVQSPTAAGLQNLFDLHNTNSLVNASEINITPQFKWNSATSEGGGAVSVDWWVSDQQGAFIGFEEYRSRDSYLSLGYQARTVFKGLEISLGLGTRQDNNDSLGDVKMFVRPTLTKALYKSEDWDLRLAIGCDILNANKPNPFVGLTLRALRF